MKNLYISSDIARRIVPALQELVRGRLGRATEVLPALQYIFLEERQVSGPVEEGIQLAVAVRQAIGHYSSFIRTEGSVRLRPPPSVVLTFCVIYLPPSIFLCPRSFAIFSFI